ncbi:class I SAM-dependent methyltransferase [Botrimarina sp.]|uniref:class I SAM-dependent methyltransferase n=1 Tax=Botrimarina sp. TaxID=2795802 RepID=UPI0032F07393
MYNRHVAPRLVHHICSSAPITEQRKRVVSQASGTVLEIGIGSGLNLPHYDGQAVERVIGVEPDLSMLKLGRERVAAAPFAVEVIEGSADAMPLDDSSADCAVITYTLCTVADPAAVLSELRRVLKPEGRLLLCEHGAASGSAARTTQHAVNGLWRRLMLGCNLNRDPIGLIEQSGFEFVDHERFVLSPLPAVIGSHYVGQARKAA